jgi:hypothetical protein
MVGICDDIWRLYRDYALGAACTRHSNLNVAILQRRVSTRGQTGSEIGDEDLV